MNNLRSDFRLTKMVSVVSHQEVRRNFVRFGGRVYAVNSGARIRIHTAALNPMKQRILMRFECFLDFWSLRRSPSQVVILAQCSDERMLGISWFLGR